MNLVMRTMLAVAAGITTLSGVVYFGAQSQHAAASRTSAVIAEDTAAQQETAKANKALGNRLAREEAASAAAQEAVRELAYSKTPQGQELERLRQEDLRAIRESGGKVPDFVKP
jgi:hypothetical protein